jgi:membrane protease YdiL (CAAX protease family)
LLVTRAAIAEELLFRGYPIPRLGELTGSRVLAGLI